MELQSEVDNDCLMQWFLKNGGGINEAIEKLHSPDYGHHYVAKSRAIHAEEVMGICPLGLTISHLNVLPAPPAGIRNCARESVCSKLVGKVNKSTVAAFFLAEQRLKGINSFWFPYLQLLPSEAEMTTPLWFKHEELIYLKGTNLFSNDVPRERTSVGLREGMYREQWELGIAALKNVDESADEFTELCLWAGTILSSRSFTSKILTPSNDDSFSVLYPVIDIFNHRFGAKMKWQLNGDTLSLCLGEKVEQSQQIFDDYAPKGNEELLMGYGFCIPNNPCDQVAFRLGQVPPEVHHKLRERVPSHWRSETWDPQESIFYIRGTSHYTSGYSNTYGIPELSCLRGIPPELAHSVYTIMLANNEDAVLSDGIEDEAQIWAGTVNALLQQAEARLLAITRWNSVLPDSPLMAGAKAASIYRMGQVKILEEVTLELRAFTDLLREATLALKLHIKKRPAWDNASTTSGLIV